MSKIDDLINRLCPDGVEYKKIEDVAEYRRGSFPQPYTNPNWYGGPDAAPFVQVADVKDKYFELKDTTKQTISKIAQPNSVFVKKGTVLITIQGTIGRVAITQYDAYVDRTIAIFSEFKIEISKKYFCYVAKQKFDLEKQYARGTTLKTITKDDFAKFEIPVPPLEIQNEIVRILDNFTELKEELEEELEARRRQYEWAKQKLLNIKKDNLVELQSVCRLEKGKTPIQKAIPGEYPLVVTTDKRSSCKDYQFDCKAVCLSLVSARGHGIAQISRIFYQEGKFALGNILCAMIPNDENQLNAKFLQYYLFYMKDILLTPLMKGGANVALHISDLQTVKIPLPPIQEQEKIVSFLNKFDELCNDETTGLPAEIEARHKQYEYYRDKLLTFKRKSA